MFELCRLALALFRSYCWPEPLGAAGAVLAGRRRGRRDRRLVLAAAASAGGVGSVGWSPGCSVMDVLVVDAMMAKDCRSQPGSATVSRMTLPALSSTGARLRAVLSAPVGLASAACPPSWPTASGWSTRSARVGRAWSGGRGTGRYDGSSRSRCCPGTSYRCGSPTVIRTCSRRTPGWSTPAASSSPPAWCAVALPTTCSPSTVLCPRTSSRCCSTSCCRLSSRCTRPVSSTAT